MPNPLTDKMNMGTELKVGLKCARCGEQVVSNQPHECKEKEKEDENSNKTEK